MKNTIFLLTLAFITLSSCGEGILTKVATSSSTESDPSTEPPVVSFSAEPADLSERDIYVYDEAPLSWTTNADKVECSRDGGTSFTDCTAAGRFQWNYADLNQLHIVRASLTGAIEDYEYSFTPSQLYMGESFLECDINVTANESFDDFEARLSANQVVCLENGVTISNSDAIDQDRILVPFSGLTIIVRKGDLAYFVSTKATGTVDDQTIFDTSDKANIRLIGLSLSRTNTLGRSIYVPDASQNVEIAYCNLTISGATKNSQDSAVYSRGGTVSNPIVVRDSTLSSDGASVITIYGGDANLSRNTFTGTYNVLYAHNSSVIQSEANTYSLVAGAPSDDSYGLVYLTSGVSLSMNGDQVIDSNGFAAFEIYNQSAGFPVVLTLASTSIIRTSDYDSRSGPVVTLGGSEAASAQINAGDSNNKICSHSVPPSFSTIADGAHAGDFVAGDYGGSITICP